GRALDLSEAGEPVKLTVRRPGLETPIVLEADIPAAERNAVVESIALGPGRGITILTADGTPAVAAGLRDGDEIRAAGGKNGEELDEWEELVAVVAAAENRPIPMTVLRPEG